MQQIKRLGGTFFIAGVLSFLTALILLVTKDPWPYNLAIINAIVLLVSVGIATIHSFYALAQISKL